MVLGPVAHPVEPGNIIGQLSADAGGVKHIIKFETQATHPVAHPEEFARIIKMHQHHRAIVLVHANLKGAGHGKAFEAWHHSSYVDTRRGGDHGDLVSIGYSENIGQLLSDNNPILARLDQIETT